MARILFAAHDPGGALMLGAVVGSARERGHDIDFLGSGPAVDLWKQEGFEVTPVETTTGVSFDPIIRPDLLATGTGFGDFEQSCWRWAQEYNIPSIAMIDAWTNLAKRFQSKAGAVYPDRIGVIDDTARLELEDMLCGAVKIELVGQPYLQMQVVKIGHLRSERQRMRNTLSIAFFSEPLNEDFAAGVRGFDQFDAFEDLVNSINSSSPVVLRVKPHPRERSEHWADVVAGCNLQSGLTVIMASEHTNDLLASSDGIIGITSMVLLESHLLGIPNISLQPNRQKIINPIIDEICEVVTERDSLRKAVSNFLKKISEEPAINPRFIPLIEEADQRFLDVLEH